MKRWRIKETYIVTGWTYIYAETKEQATQKLDNGEGEFDVTEDDDLKHKSTDWKTLEEVPE